MSSRWLTLKRKFLSFIGEFDAQGYFTIRDRKKDMAIASAVTTSIHARSTRSCSHTPR